MKLRIKYGHIIPRLLKVDGITLYPFILFRARLEQCRQDDRFPELFRHELIHVEQVRRLGWIRFYLSYLWNNMIHGYRDNPYEREAYRRQKEPLNQWQMALMIESWGGKWKAVGEAKEGRKLV